jgi:hypothetical protein
MPTPINAPSPTPDFFGDVDVGGGDVGDGFVMGGVLGFVGSVMTKFSW